MQATMMNFPLTLAHISSARAGCFPIRRSSRAFPDKSLHRYRYADFHRRAHALAGALQRLGLKRGDRVAHAHVESLRAPRSLFRDPVLRRAWCIR